MFRWSQRQQKRSAENSLPLFLAPEVVSGMWGQLASKLRRVGNTWGGLLSSVLVVSRALSSLARQSFLISFLISRQVKPPKLHPSWVSTGKNPLISYSLELPETIFTVTTSVTLFVNAAEQLLYWASVPNLADTRNLLFTLNKWNLELDRDFCCSEEAVFCKWGRGEK